MSLPAFRFGPTNALGDFNVLERTKEGFEGWLDQLREGRHWLPVGVTLDLAGVMANTAVVNVKHYGATGLGVVNEWPAISRAITAIQARGGGRLYFPAGTYLIGTTLPLMSYVTYTGDGPGLTIIDDHASLGANRTFFGTGTVNARIEWLTISNGVAGTGAPTVKKDGVRVENSTRFSMSHVEVRDIQGNYGIVPLKVSGFDVEFSRVHDFAFAAIFLLPEVEDWRIAFTEINTATSTTTANTYGFGTGGESIGQGAYFCRRGLMDHLTVKNIPRWEGIDFHGGEDVVIIQPWVENCKAGMLLSRSASGHVTTPVMKNFKIIGGTLIQGTGVNADRGGIEIAGDPGFEAENIHIFGGTKITGWGGVTTLAMGAIKVSNAKNVKIWDVIFNDYQACAVDLYSNIRGVQIKGCVFGSAVKGGLAQTAAIIVSEPGVYGIRVTENMVRPADGADGPDLFFDNRAPWGTHVEEFEYPDSSDFNLGVFNGVARLPFDKAATPTTHLVLRRGNYVYDTDGLPLDICTAPTYGYGCMVAGTIVTLTMSAGSNIATIAGNVLGDFRAFPEGMNFTIAGAGPAAANLTTRVIENRHTYLVLKHQASTPVVAAAATFVAPTLVAA